MIQGKKASPVIGGSTLSRIIVHDRKDGMYRSSVGPISDVVFRRIAFDDPGPNAAVCKGYDEVNCVRDVLIEDLWMAGRLITAGDPVLMVLEHARGIRVQGVELPAVGASAPGPPPSKPSEVLDFGTELVLEVMASGSFDLDQRIHSIVKPTPCRCTRVPCETERPGWSCERSPLAGNRSTA